MRASRGREVKAALNGVFDHLHLYVINSKSDEVLDYRNTRRRASASPRLPSAASASRAA